MDSPLPQPYRIILYPQEWWHPFCGTELKRFRRIQAALPAFRLLKNKFPSLMRGAILVDYTDEQKPRRIATGQSKPPRMAAAKMDGGKGYAIVRGRSHDQALLRA